MGKERGMIDGFEKKKILLIGDSILDIYVYGKAIGKSLETPTIVAKETETKRSFGGASLVARNILELGGKVDFITLIGNDEESKYYDGFKHKNLAAHLIIDKTRRTTIKKRFWIDGYKLLQIDNLDNRDIDKKLEEDILRKAQKIIGSCDIMVISDYRHGMLTDGLIASLKKLAGDAGKPLLVDSQISHRESNHHIYKDSFMVFLSEKEAIVLDDKFTDDFTILKKIFGKSNICVKLGEKGSICSYQGNIIRTDALKISPIDTCGAGDSFLAGFSLAGFSDTESSLRIANSWAGLSTLVHGPDPPKKEELLKLFK